MIITILCSDSGHPLNAYLRQWVERHKDKHEIRIIRDKSELSGGDILFLVSCVDFISASERAAYRASLVLHASDLPIGRGWSPHIWEIIGGAEEVTVSLVEAADEIDSGHIWKKVRVHIPKHALWYEINDALFTVQLELMDFAVEHIETVQPTPQNMTVQPTYYPRRTPTDSRLDPTKSIASQFDIIRVCDPERFPAFFELHGKKYKVILEKLND